MKAQGWFPTKRCLSWQSERIINHKRSYGHLRLNLLLSYCCQGVLPVHFYDYWASSGTILWLPRCLLILMAYEDIRGSIAFTCTKAHQQASAAFFIEIVPQIIWREQNSLTGYFRFHGCKIIVFVRLLTCLFPIVLQYDDIFDVSVASLCIIFYQFHLCVENAELHKNAQVVAITGKTVSYRYSAWSKILSLLWPIRGQFLFRFYSLCLRN